MEWLWNGIRFGFEALADRRILPPEFYFEFVTYAVITGLIVGPLLGLLGTLVVVKRMAFFSQAIGNAALVGVSIGVLVGESLTMPYISMFSFCLCFGVVMRYIQQRTSLSSDVIIGVFLSASLAIGASLILFVSARLNTHVLEGILFGSILTVNHTDLNVLLAAAIPTLVLTWIFYNRMILSSFSPTLALSRGVSVAAMEYLFVALITLVTVACVKVIGAVLVEALLVIPAAAARNVSRSLRQFVIYSVLFSTISCVAGVLVPMQLELPIPSGGAIIIIATTIFFATALKSGAGAILQARRQAP